MDKISGINGRTQEIARLREQNKELLAACKEMRQAMTDYQMDVDDPPPQKHIDMMKKADAAIAKAGKD